MQHFLGIIDRGLELRQEMDSLLEVAASAMAYARAGMQPEMLDEAMQLSAVCSRSKWMTRMSCQ